MRSKVMEKLFISLVISIFFIGCSDKDKNIVSQAKEITNYYGFSIGSEFKKSKNVSNCKEINIGPNSYISCEDKNNYFNSIMVVTKNKKTIQIMLGKEFNNDKYGKNAINTYYDIKNILSVKFKYNEEHNANKGPSLDENFCSNITSQGGTIYSSKFIDTMNNNDIKILLKGSKTNNNCSVLVIY